VRSQEIDPALLQLLLADTHANSLGADAGRSTDGKRRPPPPAPRHKLGVGVEVGRGLGSRITHARRSIAQVITGGARARLIRANEAARELDTMQVLELDSMRIIPLAHLGLVKAILSNLRTAGFEPNESNVLLRALYSYNDELNGDGLREKARASPARPGAARSPPEPEPPPPATLPPSRARTRACREPRLRAAQAWTLMIEMRSHLRAAGDALADVLGEFRHQRAGFDLPGARALTQQRADAKAVEASSADALREDEMQFLLHTFGEFMREEQLNAVGSAVRYGEHGTVSFNEFCRVLRFINPLRHRPDTRQHGSIADNKKKAYEMQQQHAFSEELASDEFGKEQRTVADRLVSALDSVMQGIDDAREARDQAQHDAKREKDGMAQLFKSGEAQVRRDLQSSEVHFG
jgi:hypothetical protein